MPTDTSTSKVVYSEVGAVITYEYVASGVVKITAINKDFILLFKNPTYSGKAFLVLRKDHPELLTLPEVEPNLPIDFEVFCDLEPNRKAGASEPPPIRRG